MTKQKKILIAPLNWGLGHATRCIPIIDELLRQGADVMLASDGDALQLLKSEYPQLKTYQLPAYNIRYPFENMVLSMGSQMPKILRGGIKEYFWLKDFLKTNPVDIVISDNRFGFFNKNVKSIFMTHQLNIQAPLSGIVDRVNYFFINKFDICWVPDYDGEPNLAGVLSHGGVAEKIKVQYLGALSRMKKLDFPKHYKAIFVLSGPEPQRTFFEKKIIEQLTHLTKNLDARSQYILVRGITQPTNVLTENKNIEIHNYLTTNILNEKIASSEVLFARSGYSTVMDIASMNSRAVLVPTPGQTEQEYLANILMKNNSVFTQKQSDFNISESLVAVQSVKGFNNFFAQ